MLKFVAEHWRWIVIPMLVALIVLGILLVLAGGDGSASPFDYPIF
jgi:hypothetical protein